MRIHANILRLRYQIDQCWQLFYNAKDADEQANIKFVRRDLEYQLARLGEIAEKGWVRFYLQNALIISVISMRVEKHASGRSNR